jgi:hypothetical protein
VKYTTYCTRTSIANVRRLRHLVTSLLHGVAGEPAAMPADTEVSRRHAVYVAYGARLTQMQ